MKSFFLCSLKDLKKQKTMTKWAGPFKDELTVIFKDGAITVFSSICPHFGGEFNIDLKNLKASCCWHGYEFDLSSGKCLSFSNCSPLRFYPFLINHGDIEVFFP
ncbi:MAG: hypothetical protein DRQ88_04420 [Epsilonproteobacteria bacterium]|nr:MAG: hypothetical protein DRQ89_10020 [Campylobacterota bacterium]RLA67003.1 MAG: hypothetical protein DRQ88_04420 [Campylobacterota bacterium]